MTTTAPEGKDTAPIYISLLGNFRITSDFFIHNGDGAGTAGFIERFQTQKTAALLAFLALQPTRAHSREFLVDLFWSDAELEKGRRSLRVALTSLRRQLEPPGVPTNRVLIADRSIVRLNFPVGVQTDVARFEAASAATESALPDAAGPLLDGALALYEGPLLPGFYDDWVLRERERLVELYRSLLLRRAAVAERRGSYATALDYARRAVNLEEDRETSGSETVCEDAHVAVIQLLVQTGRHDEAHRQYDTLARRLSEFYDEAPSPRARAFLSTEQSAGDNLPLVPVSVPVPTPVVAKTSPAREAAVPKRRLPLVLSRFFGRGPEIDQIHSALLLSGSRIVTLTGPGGSGKTRLAVEFAHRYSAAANNPAVFFASLADIEGAASMWVSIANALGAERPADTKSLRSLVIQNLLEATVGEDKPFCLLILDNFEILVDAGGPLLTGLLEAVPNLYLLVTSRRRLGLPGEHEIPVTPLPVPTLPGTPERLLEWSSVQLFVDRAQTARSDFQITSRNTEAIAALCCRLDGIPLALELTAAWAGVLSPAQMLERVESQLLDEAGPPLAYHRARRAERHRTLRAAIDSSFTLLSPELKDAFTRLSVFRGGWTLEAAECLLGEMPSPSAEILSRLRERSLLTAETDADNESVRFRMLPSLREFAGEMLSVEQNNFLRNRHAEYFTDYEDAACKAANNNQSRALSRIDADYPNYSAAIEWLSRESPIPEDSILCGLRLCGLVGWYWRLRGYAKIGCDLCRRFLEADLSVSLQNEVYFSARIATLLSAAQIAERIDADTKGEAEAWGEEALALSLEGHGVDSQRTEAYTLLGTCAMEHGNYPAARAHYETALNYKKGEMIPRTTAPLTNLGLICWYQGDFISAERYFTDSLRQNRDRKDAQSEAHDLLNLGLVACVQGDQDRAQTFLEKSLVIRREIKDRHGIVNVLGNLGEVLRKQDKPNEAREVLLESLSIARSLQDSQQIAYALGVLGTIAIQQGQFSSASDFLSESLSRLVSLGNRFHIQNALETCGALAYAIAFQSYKSNQALSAKTRSAFEQAVRFWAAADRLRDEIGNFLLEEDKATREEQMTITGAALGSQAVKAQQAAGRHRTLSDLVVEAGTKS